jgi:hypothetical protein
MSWLSSLIDVVFNILFEKKPEQKSPCRSERPTHPKSPYRAGRPTHQKTPTGRGEYRWRNKETGKVDYIGISDNLKRRKREHERSGLFSTVSHFFEWMGADDECNFSDLRAHERDSVRKHKPSKNVRGGGGGRSPRR